MVPVPRSLHQASLQLPPLPAGFSTDEPAEESLLKTRKNYCKTGLFLPSTKKTNIIIKSNKNNKTTNPNKNSKNTKSKNKTSNTRVTVNVKNQNLSVLSTNAADLNHKSEDLKNKVRYFDCGIFAIQETHYRKKGKFKMQDYHIFESI